MKNIFDKGFYTDKNLSKIGFKKIGKNVKISKSCLIVGVKNISLGNNIRIVAFTSIIAKDGYLKLENNVHIGGHGHILCAGGIIKK